MSKEKNDGILFSWEIREVGSYTDRLLKNNEGSIGTLGKSHKPYKNKQENENGQSVLCWQPSYQNTK